MAPCHKCLSIPTVAFGRSRASDVEIDRRHVLHDRTNHFCSHTDASMAPSVYMTARTAGLGLTRCDAQKRLVLAGTDSFRCDAVWRHTEEALGESLRSDGHQGVSR